MNPSLLAQIIHSLAIAQTKDDVAAAFRLKNSSLCLAEEMAIGDYLTLAWKRVGGAQGQFRRFVNGL